jgi:hypothetical protein
MCPSSSLHAMFTLAFGCKPSSLLTVCLFVTVTFGYKHTRSQVGPGVVIYWFGFIEDHPDVDLQEWRDRGILVVSRLPDEVVPRPDAPVRLPVSYTDESRLLRNRASTASGGSGSGSNNNSSVFDADPEKFFSPTLSPQDESAVSADSMRTPVRPTPSPSSVMSRRSPQVVIEDGEEAMASP